MTIIKKIVGENKKAWDSKIKHTLWVDRNTKKSSTRKFPFELVHGLDVVLPINLRSSVYKFLYHFATILEALQSRVDASVQLDENHRHAYDHLTNY